MSVAGHLDIELAEYDQRIRTFVPWYEEMIEVAAGALRHLSADPVIVDLGTGTGALAARCLQVRPDARLIGIDADAGMLEAARARLGAAAPVELRVGSFLDGPPPACDAVVASIALHHVATAERKRALYRELAGALRPGGLLVSADCFPAAEADLAAVQRDAWRAHLERSYPRAEAEGYLATWAGEDVYFPLADEQQWLRDAGLRPEVLWRRDAFAVIAARKER
ncbi:MAG TPA: class I SAM-dependent methyltransferase [Kofleriaceae bacterium]|nr:class I SAM-dependent methyltransferase [Kofleriaceae bacterium]